jgi:hypothetical protein
MYVVCDREKIVRREEKREKKKPGKKRTDSAEEG